MTAPVRGGSTASARPSTRTSRGSQKATGVLPKPQAEIEVGVGTVSPFSTPYQNAWEILRSDDVTVDKLQAMRRTDGQARALYRLITLPIRAALKGATFVPEDHVDGGEDEAAFIEQMFTLPENAGGMRVPFQRVIAQLLTAIFDGFAGFEMVYWTPTTGPLQGKWTLKKIAQRPAETLTFLVDDNSEFAGFRQRTQSQGRTIDVVIPPDTAFYYAANEEERPFYGRSYFESAFFHWDKKFKLYAVAHIAAQRAAVGTRVGKLPKNPSKEEKAKFAQSLAALGVAQWMTIPNDFDVEALKEASAFDFLAYINHHNSQMSKSILAGFFDKEQGGGDAGKLVDFGTQSDALFLLMLQTIMSEVEDVINTKVIPRFIDWNFGSAKYPKFQFGSLSAEQKQAMLDLFKTIAVGGQSLVIRPEFVHEMEVQVAEELGLEIDWQTVEAKMADEEALAQQQAQLQAITGSGITMPGTPGPTDLIGAGSPAPGQASGQASGLGKGGGHAQIDTSILPDGFTLTNPDLDVLTLSEFAAELLDEAQTLALVRGRPNSGGYKYVRTPEGAAVYGVPIGTPITRDMQVKKAGAHGEKGKASGGDNADRGNNGRGRPDSQKNAEPQRKARPSAQAQGGDQGAAGTSKTLGGGPGAQGNLGGVNTTGGGAGGLQVHAVYTNPKEPGAKLLDFGDGTVAIVDADGRMSPRQKWDVAAFAKLGWQLEATGDSANPAAAAGTAKKTGSGAAAKPAAPKA